MPMAASHCAPVNATAQSSSCLPCCLRAPQGLLGAATAAAVALIRRICMLTACCAVLCTPFWGSLEFICLCHHAGALH